TRGATSLPVCVGLGVSNGEQAASVAAFADGVIVGSAVVRRVLDHQDDEAAAASAIWQLAGELAAGCRRERSGSGLGGAAGSRPVESWSMAGYVPLVPPQRAGFVGGGCR